MATKTICDICKKEVEGRVTNITVQKNIPMAKGASYTYDLCEDCYKEKIEPVLK